METEESGAADPGGAEMDAAEGEVGHRVPVVTVEARAVPVTEAELLVAATEAVQLLPAATPACSAARYP